MATDDGTKPHGNDDQDAKTGVKGSTKKPRKPAASKDSQVGRVLQNVYQQTIDEDIPAEMLDLLNKLN